MMFRSGHTRSFSNSFHRNRRKKKNLRAVCNCSLQKQRAVCRYLLCLAMHEVSMYISIGRSLIHISLRSLMLVKQRYFKLLDIVNRRPESVMQSLPHINNLHVSHIDMWSGFYSCLGPQCFTTEGTPSQLHGICLIFALSATTAPAPATTVSNTKCSISPLISQLELCNVLLTYSKVGSSFLLVGLVLLYDLPIRSKRSFEIENAKYLLQYHSQSFAMCY